MQTVENPSEQPEREFPEPFPVMDAEALFGHGFYIMRQMYNEPLKPLLPPDGVSITTRDMWIKKLAQLCALGYVAVTYADGGGFQLTSLGRILFHDYLIRLNEHAPYEPRTPNQFFWSRYTKGELAMLDDAYGNEQLPFDLLDF